MKHYASVLAAFDQLLLQINTFKRLSILQHLSNRTGHPMIKLVHEVEGPRQQNKRILFCWVSGHTGIPVNESSDAAAKQASRRCEEFILVYYRDWDTIFDKIRERWKAQFRSGNSKLSEEEQHYKYIKT